MRIGWLLVACASACIPVVPPAHYVPVPPTSMQEVGRPTLEVGVAAGYKPAASLGYASALAGAPVLVGDASVQGGLTSVLGTGGFTLRTRPTEHQGFHFGVRLGAVAGVGDLPGISQFREPFVGGELVTQLGVGFGHPLGAWVLNLSGQSTFPLSNREYPFENDTGDPTTSVIAPGFYATADTRVDIPLSPQAAFVIGAGVDVAYFVIPLPRGAIGVRWVPRRPE